MGYLGIRFKTCPDRHSIQSQFGQGWTIAVALPIMSSPKEGERDRFKSDVRNSIGDPAEHNKTLASQFPTCWACGS